MPTITNVAACWFNDMPTNGLGFVNELKLG